MQFGENGTIEYSPNAINDKTLLLFNRLIRKLPESDFQELFDNVITDIKEHENNFLSKFTNLIVLCFMTRNCRGGKGERDLFYYFFENLCVTFPKSSKLLVKLVLHFGYGKDYFNLIRRGNISFGMVNEMFSFMGEQLTNDYKAMKENKNVSLLAKWMPRQDKQLYKEVNIALKNRYQMNGVASCVMNNLFFSCLDELKGNTSEKYRHLIVSLSQKIDVTEIKMCGRTWADIEFSHVPSIALDRYKHAFDLSLNDRQLKYFQKHCQMTDEMYNARNTSQECLADRLQCKEHYIEFLTSGKVNGSQIALDKLVENTLKECNKRNTKSFEDQTLQDLLDNSLYTMALAHRQFNSYVDYVWTQLEEAEKDANKELSASNKSINFSVEHDEVMVDVSGSMAGSPMNAAIGLGLLFTSLKKKKNPDAELSFITFDTNPTFVSLDDCKTFPAMVERTSRAEWGGATNFVSAFDMLMQRNGRDIRKATKRVICLSDMQINQAIGHSYTDYSSRVSQQKTLSGVESMYETICKKWRAWYGLLENTTELPTIVFWNLRSDVTGSPVDDSVRGVIQISGYSASLVKMLLFGEQLALESEKNEKPTASEVLYKTLAAKEYKFVREALGWKNDVLSLKSTFAKECIKIIANETESETDTETESGTDESLLELDSNSSVNYSSDENINGNFQFGSESNKENHKILDNLMNHIIIDDDTSSDDSMPPLIESNEYRQKNSTYLELMKLMEDSSEEDNKKYNLTNLFKLRNLVLQSLSQDQEQDQDLNMENKDTVNNNVLTEEVSKEVEVSNEVEASKEEQDVLQSSISEPSDETTYDISTEENLPPPPLLDFRESEVMASTGSDATTLNNVNQSSGMFEYLKSFVYRG